MTPRAMHRDPGISLQLKKTSENLRAPGISLQLKKTSELLAFPYSWRKPRKTSEQRHFLTAEENLGKPQSSWHFHKAEENLGKSRKTSELLAFPYSWRKPQIWDRQWRLCDQSSSQMGPLNYKWGCRIAQVRKVEGKNRRGGFCSILHLQAKYDTRFRIKKVNFTLN